MDSSNGTTIGNSRAAKLVKTGTPIAVILVAVVWVVQQAFSIDDKMDQKIDRAVEKMEKSFLRYEVRLKETEAVILKHEITLNRMTSLFETVSVKIGELTQEIKALREDLLEIKLQGTGDQSVKK